MNRTVTLCFHAVFFVVMLQIAAAGPRAHSGMAATVHPLATDAAVRAMRTGGNAVDGAIAAALMLAVVDGHNSGLGGGLFMLIRQPNGQFAAIDGRECAPAAATRDMFLRDGKAVPALSQDGALAAAVPGAVAALESAAHRFGRHSWRDSLYGAARVADEGWVPDRGYLARLAGEETTMRRFPASAAVFFSPRPDGKLRQPDLANTLRSIADYGAAWFYLGPMAEATHTWMRENGGLITYDDFASYQIKLREPVRTRYRGYEIVGFPPPSSGGVHVAQILAMLERFDLKAMGDNSPDFVHVVTEAMKLAFVDRAYWLGDPDFAPVPRGLVEHGYTDGLAARISMDRATPVPAHGTPPDAERDIFGKHTTHFSVADKDGWWVACTATVNTTFGSKVVVPGTGVVLNDEMDDFSAQPGAANAFGLIGAEANAVEPGKRPLSSMSPTVVLKDGRPVLSVGAAGGPTIISQVVLAIVRTVDFEQPPGAAMRGLRFHHQWRPDELRIESGASPALIAELERRGHKVRVVSSIGVSNAVGAGATPAIGFTGAHDPRVSGKADGW